MNDKDLFYKDEKELLAKLINAIENYHRLPNLSKLTEKYNWDKIISKYDLEFEGKIAQASH